MPQPINKKTLEDELASPNGFDDPFQGGRRGDIDEIPAIPDDAAGSASQFSLMPEAAEVPKPNFSFDEFNNFGIEDQDFQGEKSEHTLLSDTSSAGEGSEKSGARSRIGIKKLSLILLGVFIFIVFAGVSALYWFSGEPADGAKTILRRPVQMQYHREQSDFLVIIDAQGRKTLVSVGIEFNFLALNRHENFKKENAIFRDRVYGFLINQQPKEFTLDHWQEMMEKKLLANLTATIPQSGLARIRVTHLDLL
ncbi:MAG: hypothetical protein AB2L11_05835 [Syntrophobacteraceae bacterium]